MDIGKYLKLNVKILQVCINTLGMQLKGELEKNLWSEMFKSEKQKGLKFYELIILLTELVKEQRTKPREGKGNKIIVVRLEFNEI